MLSSLCEEKVEFLIVGAYGMAVYGLPRAAGDINLFVGLALVNSKKVFQAFKRFGTPLSDFQPDTFTQPGLIFKSVSPPANRFVDDYRRCFV